MTAHLLQSQHCLHPPSGMPPRPPTLFQIVRTRQRNIFDAQNAFLFAVMTKNYFAITHVRALRDTLLPAKPYTRGRAGASGVVAGSSDSKPQNPAQFDFQKSSPWRRCTHPACGVCPVIRSQIQEQLIFGRNVSMSSN